MESKLDEMLLRVKMRRNFKDIADAREFSEATYVLLREIVERLKILEQPARGKEKSA